MKLGIFNPLYLFLLIVSCKQADTTAQNTKVITDDFKSYWYDGNAEITSYNLTQARYGELREGSAVFVFVTEPFSKTSFTKADSDSPKNIPVLKLNFTKQFITGIYPYSMMTSSFFPLNGEEHALKISSSSQEWCGHTYMELKNDNKYDIDVRSYFEGENNRVKLPQSHLEDDVWSLIRIGPDALIVGEQKMIPSFFYLRLMHKETKAYDCKSSLDDSANHYIYKIEYPELSRTLAIKFEKKFPYKILSWEEAYPDGFGKSKKMLTTTAVLNKQMKSAYWQKNANSDEYLRNDLGLDNR